MERTLPQPARRRRTAAVISACFTLAACATTASSPSSSGPNATVVAVVDGDTIDVDIGGRRERVRLLGIDTPEIAHEAGEDRPATPGECYGDEASAFTRSLLPAGADVRLERDLVGRDHYDRILAHVHVGDVHVNAELVERGYAVPLFIEPNSVHRDLMVAAASTAEADDRGLWAAC